MLAPITAVRTRAQGASHEGPVRSYNEDAFGFAEDELGSIAIVADGMGGGFRSEAADLVVATSLDIFRGRSTSILDELAEVWWAGEHSGDPTAAAGQPNKATKGAPRARPYSTLPIRDRVELRDRVDAILKKRVPESMGDVAVLEAELRSLLAIPARGIERANAENYRRSNEEFRWRGSGASAAGVLFTAGQASIAHVGDCRVCRVRGGAIEALTREHTLVNDYKRYQPDLTEEQIAELPRNVITRAVGMSDTIAIDATSLPVEAGDVFLLMTDGIWDGFSSDELVRAVRAHGVEAARWLVEQGQSGRSNDNLTVVAVEIL